MTELEFKFEVPPERAEDVMRALNRGKTTRQLLQARYFDTADEALARHRIALRIRKEGRQWVQTAKASGDSPIDRHEHNVTLRQDGAASPMVDWRLHAGTPVGDRIAQALGVHAGSDDPPLQLMYETRVQRLARTVSTARTSVEIAFDKGRVSAGGAASPICELEIELKKGPVEPTLELARHWRAAHGLWLSTVSKAEKGHRLAQGQQVAPAATARDPAQRCDTGGAFGRQVLNLCLEQVLANASDVGSGSTDADHVHQLRVGIRRMRTAMRELADLMPPVEPGWDAPWIQLFRDLGQDRDRHYLVGLQARLEAAGGPKLDVDASAPPDPVMAVRSAESQEAFLAMLALLHNPAGEADPLAASAEVMPLLKRRLKKLLKAVLADGLHFDDLTEALQHRVRKRVKRLRYLAEFGAVYLGRGRTRRFIDALKPVQEALGDYNDEVIAMRWYTERAAHDARAWFGAGWLAARHRSNIEQCSKALRSLKDAKTPW
jgi:triphosphatase